MADNKNYLGLEALKALITKVVNSLSGKADATSIPTAVSQLTNDSKYQTEEDVSITVSSKVDRNDFLEHKNNSTIHITDLERAAWNGKVDMGQVENKGYVTSSDVESILGTKGYQNQQQVNAAITSAIGDITGFRYEVVASLPPVESGEIGVIYLVSKTREAGNIYDEYILVNTNYELIGSTDIDLSNYVTSDQLTFANIQGDPFDNSALSNGLNNLYQAGEGIDIDSDTHTISWEGVYNYQGLQGTPTDNANLINYLETTYLKQTNYSTDLSKYNNNTAKFVDEDDLTNYATKSYVEDKNYVDNNTLNAKLGEYRTATAQNAIDNTKADVEDVYTKDYVYTKQETESAITQKGYITSSQVDAKLNNYITNTTLEGKGYITSAALDGYATESFVEEKGYQNSTQVNSAIDTKLQSYSTTETINSQLANKQNKLTAGTGINISDNTISTTLTVPTKVSDLENDNQYQTQSQVQSAITAGLSGYATEAFVTSKNYTTMAAVEEKGYQNASQVSSAIASAVSDITSFEYQVVNELPQSGSKGIIYLLSHNHGEQDVYDEYIWIPNSTSGSFEKIGNTDIDLSGYALASELDTLETNALLKSSINDTAEVSANTLWSSNKVNTEIQAIKQDIASISIDGGEI